MILFATFAVTIYFSMETVFDHNITDEEWKWLSGGAIKSLYLQTVDQETAWANIAALYWLRENKELAHKYSDMLSPTKRNSLWRTLLHP